jgi:post-segregation antitoxin (ccd killing protein)
VATARKKKGAQPKRAAYQPPVSYLRRTITIPPELNAAIDEQIGSQNFSAFAQSAIKRELQRLRLREWLAEREAEHGGEPPSQEDIDYVERAWRNRK